MLTLGNTSYCLQCVQFMTSQLSILAALPRTMDRRLNEGMNSLFEGLLAVFRIQKLSMN